MELLWEDLLLEDFPTPFPLLLSLEEDSVRDELVEDVFLDDFPA